MHPNQPQVIQGSFVGGSLSFAVQTKPAFANAVQPKMAPHVQAAIQRNTSPVQAVQKTPFPNTIAQRQITPHVQAALQKNAPHFQAAQRQAGSFPQNTQRGAVQPQAVQRMGAGMATQVPNGALNLRQGPPGKPLPEATQRKMETLFKADFSAVRIHVGPQAQQIGARAFTLGSDIYFAPGQYNPTTSHGQRLIGHELAHVVQQKERRVRHPFGNGMAVVQNPGLEAEAESMALKAVSQQLSRAPDAGLTRSHTLQTSKIIQRQLKGNCTSWLKGRQPTAVLIKNYYDNFVKKELSDADSFVPDNTYEEKQLKESKTNYKNRKKSAKQYNYPRNWQLVAEALDLYVDAINRALLKVHAKSEVYRLQGKDSYYDFYRNTARANWATVDKALRGMDAMTSNSTKTPKDGSMPNIPVIPFSNTANGMPPSLRLLIKKIYDEWNAGRAFDRRSTSEQTNKTITSDTPGALRSWHLNDRGSLPANQFDVNNIPLKAQPLHTHYDTSSKKPGNVQSNVTTPVGYAEYTGTGITGDAHNCKIVLDYVNGDIYVTVTHYQLWDKGNKYKQKGQNAGSGTYSAWFYIDNIA